MKEIEKFELLKADAKDAKYSNPALRLLLTVGYLGVFSCIVAVYMIFMSAMSREDHGFDVNYTAAVIVIFLICLAAVIVLNKLDKKARKEFFENEKKLRKNAKKYRGKIISAEKNIRHVKYMSEVFDEILWNFVVKYKDENGEIKTVKSERFLNDVSQVLKSRYINVYALEDGTFQFGGYKLREDPEEEFVSLKVIIHEEDSKV